MVLVVGATGLLGTGICRLVLAAGRPVRALVRNSSDRGKVEALKSAGATLAFGDLKDPDSLIAACQGASAVMTTASCTFSRQEGDSIETVDRQGHLNLIEAARRAGARHFIHVSIPPGVRDECPLYQAKREVEDTLVQSGMDYTILLANYFMEVWLSPALGFDCPNGRATVYGSGERPLAWVSYGDVASIAVACLEVAAARNRMLLVGGPENQSPREVVQAFERAGGRPFAVDHVAEETLEKQYVEAADPLSRSFAALMLLYARGCAMDISETLQILPRRLTTIADYAATVMGGQRAAAL